MEGKGTGDGEPWEYPVAGPALTPGDLTIRRHKAGRADDG
jgi:hypothetical protein